MWASSGFEGPLLLLALVPYASVELQGQGPQDTPVLDRDDDRRPIGAIRHIRDPLEIALPVLVAGPDELPVGLGRHSPRLGVFVAGRFPDLHRAEG